MKAEAKRSQHLQEKNQNRKCSCNVSKNMIKIIQESTVMCVFERFCTFRVSFVVLFVYLYVCLSVLFLYILLFVNVVPKAFLYNTCVMRRAYIEYK